MPIAANMQCRCGRFKRSRKTHVLVCVTTRWHKPLTNAVVTKIHAFIFRSVHIFLLPENVFWIFFHGAVVSSKCIMDILSYTYFISSDYMNMRRSQSQNTGNLSSIYFRNLIVNYTHYGRHSLIAYVYLNNRNFIRASYFNRHWGQSEKYG